MPGWKSDMLQLADHAFRRLRTRLEGVTDDEYFWQPVPGSWTVRPDGDGAFHGDWQQPVWPPPFTTIAWRVTHVISNLFDARYATNLGLSPRAEPPATPGTARDALAALEAGYAATRSYLEAVPDATLGELLGPIAGPWADDDRGSFVLHMLDELIHHAAEIGVLRDLYRATQPPNPILEALLAGDRDAVTATPENEALIARARSERADLMLQATSEARWSAVPVLVDHGFSIAMPDGTSAVHHAAAAGNVETLAYLIDAGADASLRDGLYRATPQEWAEFFDQAAAAEYLSTLHSG